ncbi:MAG TPA: hypothetical protein PLT04_04290 [Candidatus Saccharibacteria bacterium]|nr:hypothetical protein [Candidatus Saccharibacteria bacterium]
MAFPGEQEYQVDLNGRAAIDTPLNEIRSAIEDTIGHGVTLGIQRGGNTWFDQDVTGAVLGSSSFLAYGEQEPVLSEYRPSSGKLTQPWQDAVYVKGYIEGRDANTAVDPRLFSRTLFLDAEVKAAGDFSRTKVDSLVNVSANAILSSGIDLSNVSGSQARRVVDAIREQYTAGEWQNALQLAIATKHLGHLVRYAAEASYRDLSDSTVTVSDAHIEEVLDEEFGTDVLFLTMRALKMGIKDLRASDRNVAANHGEQWLTMLEDGVLLDKFTPEVTTADVLVYPSYMNPRPDKGVPTLAPVAYLAGGTGSRNHTIKYPNGDVYAVDYPDGAARPIKDHQEDGFAGNLEDGTVKGFVHTNEDWIDFEATVDNHLAGTAVEALMQQGVSFKDLQIAYNDILREAAVVAGNQSDAVKTKVAAGIAIAQQLALAQINPGKAVELYSYSVRGWGSKSDIEDQTGISLTWKWEGIDGLGADGSALYSRFGGSLNKFALTKLAERYAGHPELADKIAKQRSKFEATDDAETYLHEMLQAAEQLLDDEQVQEALSHSRLAKVSI